MSDLLDRLIARGRGDAPTVRPRLPGLFEDDTGAVLPTDEEEERVVERSAASKGESTGSEVRATPVIPPLPELSRPADTQTAAPPKGPRPAEHEQKVPSFDPADRPLTSVPDQPSAVAQQPTLPPQTTSKGTEATLSTSPLPPVPESYVESSSERYPDSNRPVREQASLPPPATVSAPPSLVDAPAEEIVAVAPQPPPAPRVEVRIGRIEVRGAPIQPPAPQARSQQPSSRMPRTTLDDYLRRRREG
jgi:hypothetical protein